MILILLCFIIVIIVLFLKLRNKIANLGFSLILGFIGFVIIPLLEFELYNNNRNNYVASDEIIQNEINAQISQLENDIQSRANKLSKEEVMYLLNATKSLTDDSVLVFRRINFNNFSIKCISNDMFHLNWVIEKDGRERLNIKKIGAPFYSDLNRVLLDELNEIENVEDSKKKLENLKSVNLHSIDVPRKEFFVEAMSGFFYSDLKPNNVNTKLISYFKLFLQLLVTTVFSNSITKSNKTI